VSVSELIAEADRQMTICNACRYCEGYCAVWPSIELRRTFSRGDIEYLANLCFDCRDCFYACQYAPPHAFAINPPQIFAQVRTATYEQYTWPHVLGRLVRSGGRTMAVCTLAGVLLVLGLVLAFTGPATVFAVQTGEGAFYRIIPYSLMVAPFAALMLYWLAVWASGVVRYWRSIAAGPSDVVSMGAFLRATGDAFGLSYLDGGGVGCTYPTERFSQARRWLHHLVFYGFLLDVASTTLAAVYDHFLDQQAPYPLLHPVVILGTLGGVGLLVGTAGLLVLKGRSDRVPSERQMLSMDAAFLLALFLVAATGMVLLWLRETVAMGTLLAIHLGTVAAVFVTAPYGKFAHMIYRYVALVRYAVEQKRLAAVPSEH
jgi:citrate/tricarballylate utilization protein